MADPTVVPNVSNVTSLLGLLVVIAVVAAVVRYIHLPYAVALVLTGLALALVPGVARVELTPQLILEIFLPVLLFRGAYNLDLEDLRANLTAISLLAVPGVILTAVLMALALHTWAGMGWLDGLIFGTIVGATDPVAVLGVFGEVGAPVRLNVVVTGESLFNDGTALVFFSTMLGVAVSKHFSLGATTEQFFITVAGALALGFVVAVVGAAVLAGVDDALLATTVTLIMAYGGYLMAERLGISGPLETVAAGVLLGARGNQVMSPATRINTRATWEFLDFLANSLLFLLVGMDLRPIKANTMLAFGSSIWLPLGVAVVALLGSRVVLVWSVALVLRLMGRPLPSRWRVVLVWAGLRGAVSLAAALSIPTSMAVRSVLLGLTFGIVLFTLLVQGLTIGPLLQRLHIGQGDQSLASYEMLLGRLGARRAGLRELEQMRESGEVDEATALSLEHEYSEQFEELREDLADHYKDRPVTRIYPRHMLRRRLLLAQRRAVLALADRGMISAAARDNLIEEIDSSLARHEPSIEGGTELTQEE